MTQLYMFLASHDSFSVALKKELNNIPCEEILTDLVNLCCDMYDQKRYLTPETKHVLLKVRHMAIGCYGRRKEGWGWGGGGSGEGGKRGAGRVGGGEGGKK